MKTTKFLITALFLIIYSRIQAQSWNELEDKHLTLVTYCKGEMKDSKFVPSDNWVAGLAPEKIILHGDSLEWIRQDGSTVYSVIKEDNSLSITKCLSNEEQINIDWLNIYDQDSKIVFLWCSDNILRAFEK